MLELKNIKKRSKNGHSVQIWQYFLSRKGLYNGPIDRDFGNGTEKATKEYQRLVGLPDTGVVREDTYNIAFNDGLTELLNDLSFPPKPNFSQISRTNIKQIFGGFNFVSAPTSRDSRTIKILDNWDKINIVRTKLPELKGVKVGKTVSSGTMQVHKLLENQMIKLWAAWGKSSLANKVLTYEGSFVPRFIGNTVKLSYHSYGTTFDINYNWNKWGFLPAPLGEEGSVRELVPIANEFGFYWGGHFNSKLDGMHFEVAKLLTNDELKNLAKKYGI